MNNSPAQQIKQLFQQRGQDNYGVEKVTQLQHACQCGSLALNANVDNALVIAAFLHDIGHILSEEALPKSLQADLHDHHEERGYTFLAQFFDDRILDPIRLHVEAKRYLCTKNPDYAKKLSPTSYESYIDQGGPMSKEEMKAFESELFYSEALKVREWDDTAKMEGQLPYGLDYFISLIDQYLAEHKN